LPASLRTLPALLRRRRFQPPPADLYKHAETEYLPGHATYTDYNYLSAGPLAQLKSAHFEAALDLVADLARTTGAIDFGCADGVFLPTLDRWFDPVLAIDDDPAMIAHAQRAVDALGLGAEILANTGMSWAELRERVDAARYGVVFLLETLEHVGTADDMVGSRIAFLRELIAIAAPGATIVVSVPNMVGVPFALQRIGLAATRSAREPIAARDLMRAVVLKDVDRLEPKWQRHMHLGFNHRKLERAMRREFEVVGKRDLIFSKVYAIRTARASGHA
jgi:2-polyprenyl-3-methyl-5-hydroxy-6-metoxy-1,4-benzoquinol methylase